MAAVTPPAAAPALPPAVLAWLFATSLLARVPLAATGIVVILHTRELTGSYAAGGAAAAAYALASGVGQPLLARLVDRRGQAPVLLPGALVAAAALAGFALLPHGAPLAAIAGTTAVAGLATPPLGAALRTLLPGLLPDRERLRAAYALESSALEITYVVGPLVFAGALATWSTAAAALACGALLLGGTAAFLATPASRAWRPSPPAPERHGALRSPGIRTLCLVLALVGLTFGAIEVAVPVAAEAAGHASVAGPLLSLWGLGSLLGGLLAMRLTRPAAPVRRLLATTAVLAAGHVVLPAAAGSLLLLAALLLLAGLAIAPSFAAAFALTDGLAPPGTLTEAFAWLSTGIAAGLAAGAALGGAVAESGGADAALLVAGSAASAALVTAVARRRTLGG